MMKIIGILIVGIIILGISVELIGEINTLFLTIIILIIFLIHFYRTFIDISEKVIDILHYIIEKEGYIVPNKHKHIFSRKEKSDNLIVFLDQYTKEMKLAQKKHLKNVGETEIRGKKMKDVFGDMCNNIH